MKMLGVCAGLLGMLAGGSLTGGSLADGGERLVRKARKRGRPETVATQVTRHFSRGRANDHCAQKGIVYVRYQLDDRNRVRILAAQGTRECLVTYVQTNLGGQLLADPTYPPEAVRHLKLRFDFE